MFDYCKNQDGEYFWETDLPGHFILECSLLNKGSAFSPEERRALGLAGLAPFHVSTMDQQLQRTYESFQKEKSPLEKYLYLMDLCARNETLFYALLQNHIAEMMPIVYTPVVGLACQKYSHIYRRPRGLYIAYPQRDEIPQILDHVHNPNIEVIVVSDGERILGLGDLGAGGMGIPIGKLTLYSLCAGIHPYNTLPILVDCGTDNEKLLQDPLYLGWRHHRIRGEEYDKFIEAFVSAVKEKFPRVILQWEDFAKQNAERLLLKYQQRICSFNDDIQGTGAVALAGLLSACKVKGTSIKDEKIFMVGSGSAAKGIVEEIITAMEEEGLAREEGKKRIYLWDSRGLVYQGREGLSEAFKQKYARPQDEIERLGLVQATLEEGVDKIHPTTLIGTSAQPAIFHEGVIRKMASHTERPMVFPISNPTSKSEAIPQDVINWTDGKALVATGSPFPPVIYQGKTIPIGQCNNVFIFPGVGLGVLASGATEVTTSMFVAAARTLSDQSPALKDPQAPLYPALETVKSLSRKIALAVALVAQKAGLAPVTSTEEMEKKIEEKIWDPKYLPIYRRGKSSEC